MTCLEAQTETSIVNAIREYLEMVGCIAVRINAGAVVVSPGEGKSRRLYRGAPAGTSDILGCLPGGRFFALEAKRPGMKPTEKQSAFLESVRATGGIAGVACSVEEAAEVLGLPGVQ